MVDDVIELDVRERDHEAFERPQAGLDGRREHAARERWRAMRVGPPVVAVVDAHRPHHTHGTRSASPAHWHSPDKTAPLGGGRERRGRRSAPRACGRSIGSAPGGCPTRFSRAQAPGVELRRPLYVRTLVIARALLRPGFRRAATHIAARRFSRVSPPRSSFARHIHTGPPGSEAGRPVYGPQTMRGPFGSGGSCGNFGELVRRSCSRARAVSTSASAPPTTTTAAPMARAPPRVNVAPFDAACSWRRPRRCRRPRRARRATRR